MTRIKDNEGKGKGAFNPLHMVMTAMGKGMDATKRGWYGNPEGGKGKGGKPGIKGGLAEVVE